MARGQINKLFDNLRFRLILLVLLGVVPALIVTYLSGMEQRRLATRTTKRDQNIIINKSSIVILMADDDPDDRAMTEEALCEARVINSIRFVCDGEELMDYLLHKGEYTHPESSPRPGLLLLDLNMPRKDGREAAGLFFGAGRSDASGA